MQEGGEDMEGGSKFFKGKVNAYGFIHLTKKLMEAWDIQKDGNKFEITQVTIELTVDCALIIRKVGGKESE